MSPKDLTSVIDNLGEIMQCRVNCNASQVSLTYAYTNLLPSPVMYVILLDVGMANTYSYNNSSENDVTSPSDESARFITNHYWDTQEANILVCEGRISSESPEKQSITNQPSQTVLTSFHSSLEHKLLILENAKPMTKDFLSLLRTEAPNYIILNKPSKQRVQCEKLTMRDFEGIENCDDVSRSAVINFSYFLNTENLDEAFKSIAAITSDSVWKSLARMCIKTKRLDVAKICLGNMKDIQGLWSLRLAENEPELEAKVAALAIHLQLFNDAEELYRSCQRYDLLNRLHQRRAKWDSAIEIAEKYDRISLKNTYHRYAKFLELRGDIDRAIKMYEKAETHRHQVPRMLLENPDKLEKYSVQSKDPALLKWWAQYIESTEDMETAMKYYEESQDYLSMVRVLCFLQDFDRAAELANSSADSSACYHLARQYENNGHFDDAIHFYTVAGSLSNAIRLCKEQALDEQLWNLSLSAGASEQIEAAGYLECIEPDKAVLLYHRAGALHKALDLSFKCGQFDAVESIASELNSESDSDLILKCANFFLSKEHFDRAVHLFAIAQKYDQALSICMEKRVPLTEELADLLTPAEDVLNRVTILQQIGNCAAIQANYHLATKIFTQAGDKVKAMKCLLKSGDTEKIIFFAGVSRMKEIYVMAGNYLQTTDWKSHPEILKNIISFYTKGKAPHLLANFYVSCSQVEIDEFGNYEKALGALHEAKRCLLKYDDNMYDNFKKSIEEKIVEVEKFLEMKRLFEKDEGNNAMLLSRQLLTVSLDIVRMGDVFSRMIEYTTKQRDWNTTTQLIHELKKKLPHENLTYYVPQELLSKLGLIENEEATVVESEDEVPEEIKA